MLCAALGVSVLGIVSGCQTSKGPRGYEPVIAQFFLETAAADPKAAVATLPHSGVGIPFSPRVVFSEGDVVDVELVKVDLGLCLMFVFGPEAARSLFRVSAANLGRRLIVTLNGRPFGAREFDAPIHDGRLFIFVELPDDELSKTAVNLKHTAADIQAAVARKRS